VQGEIIISLVRGDGRKRGDLNTFHLNLAVGPIHLLTRWVPGFFPGPKNVRLDVCQSPPSSAEVKNEWTHTSTPRPCLHDVERANFTFAFFNIVCSRRKIEFVFRQAGFGRGVQLLVY
jgi:hypothetical protein